MEGRKMILWGAVVLAMAWLIYSVRSILTPFILAFLISAILEPGVKFLQKRGWSKGFSVFALFTSFFGTIILLLVLLTPFFSQQVAGFKDRAQVIVESIAKPDPSQNFFVRAQIESRSNNIQNKDWLDKALSSQSELLGRMNLPTTKRAIYAQYVEPQRGQIGKSVQGFISSFIGIASGLVSQVLMLIFVPLLVLMILPNTDQLRRKVVTLIPPQLRRSSVDLADDMGEVFGNYLRGVSIAVFGYMAFMSLLLSVLGAPYGLLLGVLFGALYLVPYLNVAISGTVLFAVTALSGRSGSWFFTMPSPVHYAVLLIGIYVVCHFVFDSAVYPRFVGQSVGLDPIVSMFVIFSGGALFGLPGMILAFPAAGAVKVILDRVIGYTNRVDNELTLPKVPHRHKEAST